MQQKRTYTHLSEMQKFKVIRPLNSIFQTTVEGIPIIRNAHPLVNDLNCSKQLINFKNTRANRDDNHNKIVHMFLFDYVLESVWNNPHRHLRKLQEYYAVLTPDFSTFTNMTRPQIIWSVFKNRWIGCFWQQNDIIVIPTISWAKEDTFDICFSGVEKGSIVAISTLGCQHNISEFLNGYNTMLNVIEPELIIVVGNYIEGMTGKMILVPYKDSFGHSQSFRQMSLFSNIYVVSEKGGQLQWAEEVLG